MRELERRVQAALLAEAPDACIEPVGSCAQVNVDGDVALLDAVLASGGSSRALRIWASPASVVISKRLAAQLSVAAVRESLLPLGVDLAVRASGGSAVVHRPGVLNVSLAQVAPQAGTMAGAYAELTRLLSQTLLRLGLVTSAGQAAGAYCDGAHNLLWRGRKLAGTAAVVRRRGGRTAHLVHASLMVWGDVRADLRLIHAVERGGRCPQTYIPSAHVTVAEALDQAIEETPPEPLRSRGAASADASRVSRANERRVS
jgi:octanoyl-[GcvH]:protein N-octanoyltransferase